MVVGHKLQVLILQYSPDKCKQVLAKTDIRAMCSSPQLLDQSRGLAFARFGAHCVLQICCKRAAQHCSSSSDTAAVPLGKGEAGVT